MGSLTGDGDTGQGAQRAQRVAPCGGATASVKWMCANRVLIGKKLRTQSHYRARLPETHGRSVSGRGDHRA